MVEQESADKERSRRKDHESEGNNEAARLVLQTEGAEEVNSGERQAERRSDANEIGAGEFQRSHVGLIVVGPDRVEDAGEAKERKNDDAGRRDPRKGRQRWQREGNTENREQPYARVASE